MTTDAAAMTALKDLRRSFCDLPAPAVAELTGVYRAEFIGPAWLRRLAPPALALSGLAGWWGKTFDGRGSASNIVMRGGVRSKVLPMTAAEAASLLDGEPSLTLRYLAGSAFPWPWVVDEIRQLDEETFLCMSLTRWQWAAGLALPFLLHRTDLT